MLKRKHAALAALLMAAAAASAMLSPAQAFAAEKEDYADAVVTLVNAERAAAGLDPLYAVPALNEAAAVRAAETTASFSHTRPDGRSCSTVLNDAGIPWRSSGENIAYGYASPEAVMDGWMHSDGHRANILGNFDYIGVGAVERNGTLYWAQVFTGGAALDGAYLPGSAAVPVVPEQPAVTPEAPAVPETPAPTEDCPDGQCGTPYTLCIGDACPVYTCTDGDCASECSGLCIGGICIGGGAPAGGICSNPLQTLLQGCMSGGCGNLASLFGCSK